MLLRYANNSVLLYINSRNQIGWMDEAQEWVKMAKMSSKKNVLDSEEASVMVMRLRDTFDSGKTRSYKWRVSQLEAIINLTDQNQHLIFQALHSDLSKPETEAFIHEVLFFLLFSLHNHITLLFVHFLSVQYYLLLSVYI